MATYFGFNPPFLTEDAVLPAQFDERLVKNDLLQLLLTSPGERVMRPTFGTPLRAFPFEQLDNKSLDTLKRGIKNAIAQFENRVIFKDITIVPDVDNHQVSVVLLVSLISNPKTILTVETNIPTAQITS